jgi:hypothetical protein
MTNDERRRTLQRLYDLSDHCRQCGRRLNPVDAAIEKTCRTCCQENHKSLAGPASARKDRRG